MAKKIKTIVKLLVPGGQATPAPPVGPALGQAGINIADFCKKFNDLTKDKIGQTLPVKLVVYEDRSFDFFIKTPLTSELLKKAAGVEKGSGKPLQEKVGKISRSQIREIAKIKMPDLNTNNLEQAMKIIEGTAKQMGLEIVD
ncbi:MAG: 50S ribosomal protein L11 [Patescibacteria group bacterium]|nr:50S ribosomal protein L11 [Patescibacteria group bacterium]